MERYISFPLFSEIMAYAKYKDWFSGQYRKEHREILENFHRELGELQTKYKEEIESIEKGRVDLNEKVKKELGENYSLLDICPSSGRVLREKVKY